MKATTPHELWRSARFGALAMTLAAGLTLTPAAQAGDCATPGPVLTPLTHLLTSNRYSGLPNNRLQLTAFYDGLAGSPALLRVQLANPADWTDVAWIEVLVDKFDHVNGVGTIVTQEYNVTGYAPTGIFQVSGVLSDGIVDGVGFGLFWRDGGGDYHFFQSGGYAPHHEAHYVGAWPLGMNDATFALGTPGLDPFSRHQARMMVYGAELMPNGCHELSTLQWAALPTARPIGIDTVAPQTMLSSNRFNMLPHGTVQVTVFYDGAGTASLGIEVRDWLGNEKWIRVDAAKFDTEVVFQEFFIPGYGLTGRFVVEGVTPDGVIDGMAFAVLWRDYEGFFRTVRSDSAVLNTRNEHIGGWAHGYGSTYYRDTLLGVTSFPGEQSQMSLWGAKLVGNGEYQHEALFVPDANPNN